MEAYTIVLLSLGGITMTVGGLMQLVAAFRQSIWWGLASMILPFASLVFIAMHWAQAKAGFLTGLAGAALMVGGVVTAEPLRAAYAGAMGGKPTFSFALPGLSGNAPVPAPPKDLNAQIQDKRDQIEQLETQFGQAGVALVAQFQALTAQRNALPTGDAAARTKYDAAAGAYQAMNTAQKQRQQELAMLHQSLDDLLAERSKKQAATAQANPDIPVSFQKPAAPLPVSTGSKKVVMYTTSTCPACRAAKQYFARKGVSYEEHDVNGSSSAREEFQRLGGSGVPLILVGNEKMTGFSEQRLNQLL